MVEMSLTEASKSLEAKLAALSNRVTASVLDGIYNQTTDSHCKQDVIGIRSALKKDYPAAAQILVQESEYIKQNPKERTPEKNNMIALAFTMCAVSHLYGRRYDEAERLLRQEQQLDAINWNKDPIIKALNQDALRVVLLQQGKFDEAAILDKASATKGEFSNSPNQNETEKTGIAVAKEFNKVKATFTVEGLVNFEAQMANRIEVTEKKLAEIQKQYDVAPDAKKAALKAQFERETNNWNRDTVIKYEISCLKSAFAGEWEKVETPQTKEAILAVDSCEDMRRAFPDITEAASSIYGFYLLRFSRYEEAEKRFRMEMNRDRTGKNTSESIYKQLNELGLRYVLLKQGKFEEIAKLNNTRIGAIQAPVPKAVFFR